MASTRNKNTTGNYCLEQRSFLNSENYSLYKNSQYGQAYITENPGNGLLPGQIPANQLSFNSIDVESFLYGINSTNLVNPIKEFTPELKRLPDANIYKTPTTYLPVPLHVGKNRPFPTPA